jgi:tetratricopeptide (TPR) repeat protein
LRGEGAARALAHLEPVDGGFRVVAPIRYATVFEELNLVTGDFPSVATNTWNVHVLFCRNVLYYFDQATIARVVERLSSALAIGGWLVLSASDPLVAEYGPLEPVVTAGGILYRRVEGHRAAPPLREPAVPGPPAPKSVARQKRRTRPPSVPASRLEATERTTAAKIREVAAEGGPFAALEAARKAIRHDPLDVELNYAYADLLDETGSADEAAAAFRKVFYLDRSLAIAHFRLGLVLEGARDDAAALKAYRNAWQLARQRERDDALPLGDGETAGAVADAAAARIARMEDHGRT